MTLLEQYAGMAMQGIISNPVLMESFIRRGEGNWSKVLAGVAIAAVEHAKYLIEEVKKYETV